MALRWLVLVVAGLGLLRAGRLEPERIVDNFADLFANASTEHNAEQFHQEFVAACSIPDNGTEETTPLGELIYNNWYLFEKVYRTALNNGKLSYNLIDFCVTEARLFSLIRSNHLTADKLTSKQKDLAIKYKVLSADEKASVEKALPGAATAVNSIDFWKKL